MVKVCTNLRSMFYHGMFKQIIRQWSFYNKLFHVIKLIISDEMQEYKFHMQMKENWIGHILIVI